MEYVVVTISDEEGNVTDSLRVSLPPDLDSIGTSNAVREVLERAFEVDDD